MNLFESKDKTINPRGYTVEQWLAQPIHPYFPALWQQKMDPSIKKITFRHLLQHRSGFRSLGKEDLGADQQKRMFDYLAAGIEGADFDQRKYANANFSLVTYLVPMIAHPDFLARVNQEASDKKWRAEGIEIHKRVADAWEAHMHGNIYGRITPAIKPSCNPTVEYAKIKQAWAPDYASAGDAGNGVTHDSRVINGYCQAQGGWYIESRELAAFVANFSAAKTLVSGATRDLM
ncbi:serine hydrolase [Massilia glaciei]|uniref:serine hydrolase n=1 Tax=Massilia glaciei TaxID=1524097 RepID=UPI000D0F7C06|nr:serine hydrolase [Massilia glaciei]